MYLTLPIPSGRFAKATLHQCLDAFVSEEVMEKEDAWNCPNCKALRRATKQLSISRLPPVLLIHLKRFTTKGHFTDKLETFVDFPLKGLDLTNYMPAPLPPGVDRKRSAPISLDDPRSQVPPYRYDLYAVTNHFGTLSSGHCECFYSLFVWDAVSKGALQTRRSSTHAGTGSTATIAGYPPPMLARSWCVSPFPLTTLASLTPFLSRRVNQRTSYTTKESNPSLQPRRIPFFVYYYVFPSITSFIPPKSFVHFIPAFRDTSTGVAMCFYSLYFQYHFPGL